MDHSSTSASGRGYRERQQPWPARLLAPGCGRLGGTLTTRSLPDDDQERRGRLLLLGKGAVLAHRLARPLAAESDESEQSADTTARELAGCSFPTMRALGPYAARARLARAPAAPDRPTTDACPPGRSRRRRGINPRSGRSSHATASPTPAQTLGLRGDAGVGRSRTWVAGARQERWRGVPSRPVTWAELAYGGSGETLAKVTIAGRLAFVGPVSGLLSISGMPANASTHARRGT